MTDDPVAIPITGELDLHTFRPEEVHLLVKDYIGECLKRGIPKVRIIHGKGKGQLRATVQSVLEKDPRVKKFGDAAPGEGGWGATWAVLK